MPFAYPIALDLTGRRCLVIGGDAVAEAKARSLRDGGGMVTVFGPDPSPGLVDLERYGEILLERRPYRPGDLAGAFLVVSSDRRHSAAVHAEAERLGVLCNAVDDITHSHFAAPSVVRRGDLVLTVSTGGRSPALAKRLRQRLGAAFGPEYGALVDLLGTAREAALAGRTGDFDSWARRWADIVADEEDLLALVRAGRADEIVSRVVEALGGGPGVTDLGPAKWCHQHRPPADAGTDVPAYGTIRAQHG